MSLSRVDNAAPPRDTAALFAALGDETRLDLVGKLSARGPASISRLTAGSKVSRQAVTKHLRVLSDAGLVRSSRRGRESIWELEPSRLDEARHRLDLIAARWNRALEELKAFVESADTDDPG